MKIFFPIKKKNSKNIFNTYLNRETICHHIDQGRPVFNDVIFQLTVCGDSGQRGMNARMELKKGAGKTWDLGPRASFPEAEKPSCLAQHYWKENFRKQNIFSAFIDAEHRYKSPCPCQSISLCVSFVKS